jgi:hypothetical protein
LILYPWTIDEDRRLVGRTPFLTIVAFRRYVVGPMCSAQPSGQPTETSLAQHGQVELPQPIAVAYDLDFDDLPVLQRETQHSEEMAARRDYNAH